ncbi:hypothetical protein BGX28_005834 [Mortierella sp. GBA30]|nr:hypothetical protein BGX28_005834 [Mortierella sp. GBA30]
MNFPSLLSDHEQRAFSDFLNQLAQEDHPNTDGSNGPGGADPTLTQQQQQQLQLQLQHHLHLRQLQQQHQQQQQVQNGVAGLPRLPPPPSLPSPSLPLDGTAQQLALAQQQRDWIQQISANPLLAPGGVINPHAMSQAMLQNPLLMAQANAISQAMVLAQQQQQQQLQLQQQQQRQQQQQQQHFQQHQQQQQHDGHTHPLHRLQPQTHAFAPQTTNMLPPFHAQQQQYPSQQQQQPHLHSNQEPLSPSESGTPGIQMSTKPATKRKSKVGSSGTIADSVGESSSSRSSSPFSQAQMSTQNIQEDADGISNANGTAHIPKQESDVESGSAAPPSKKTARRKGSTAKSSMESSSGLVVKSAHRSSRDGFDPLQGNPRRKARGESISKNSVSQQNNNGNATDTDSRKDRTEYMESKLEDPHHSPLVQQDSTLSPTPSQNSSSGQPQSKSGSKKPHHELLTEAEKKANHIASEQKRRQNIRVGFDSLVEIVPTLSDCHRSEAVILQKSVEYIHRLLNQKNELKSRVRDLQVHLGDPLDDVDSDPTCDKGAYGGGPAPAAANDGFPQETGNKHRSSRSPAKGSKQDSESHSMSGIVSIDDIPDGDDISSPSDSDQIEEGHSPSLPALDEPLDEDSLIVVRPGVQQDEAKVAAEQVVSDSAHEPSGQEPLSSAKSFESPHSSALAVAAAAFDGDPVPPNLTTPEPYASRPERGALTPESGALTPDSGAFTPKSGILTPESDTLTPDMLPLIELNHGDIERISGMVPGGLSNIHDICSLSPSQEGILTQRLLATEGDPYLVTSTIAFEDRSLLDRYLAAFRTVVDRHDTLRASFLWENLSATVQVVHHSVPLPIEELVLDPSDGGTVEQLERRFNPKHHRIDLGQGPLLRFIIAKDTDDRWILLQMIHRLIADREAEEEIQAEIKALLDGRGASLSTPGSLHEHLAAVRQRSALEADEKFFREMLLDIDEPTLPFNQTRVEGDVEIKESHHILPQELNDRIRLQAQRLQVSLAAVCHLAWAQVLARTSGQQQVVFGTVLSGRRQAEDENRRALGPTMNILPFRCDIDKRSALECVQNTHSCLIALLGRRDASLTLAERCSSVPAGTPLFSGLLNCRNSSSPTIVVRNESNADFAYQRRWFEYPGLQFLRSQERAHYPFALSVDDFGTGLSVTAQVMHPIDPFRVCAYMQKALESLAEALEDNGATPVHRLEVLPAEELQMMLGDWNATQEYYPDNLCLHHLFEQQVERTPEANAIVHEDRYLTYAELNARANCLAHQLIRLGVCPDMPVAICIERSFSMVTGVLAILKAGGAYVPLDPFYSSDRLRDILDDTAPTILVADSTGRTALGEKALNSLATVDPNTPQQGNTNNPQLTGLTSRHLAYIIYTSGSTGKPKGVAVEHQGTVNLVYGRPKMFEIYPDSHVLQFASLNFTHSASEIFSTFSAGASLYLLRDDIRRDRDQLWDFLHRNSITHFSVTPSLLHDCKDMPPLNSLRALITVGEAMPPTLPQALRVLVPNSTILNCYGMSESISTTVWKCPKDFKGGLVPIGRPIPNKRIYLLDTHGNPVPLGAVGEMYAGGVGIARGYWNQPELTAERFLQDPFIELANARMYNTGDLARYLPDGSLVYVGRKDHQVKIRGFRVEPGEIEARLKQHPSLSEAVVVATGEEASKRLVAYVIAKSGEKTVHSTDGDQCNCPRCCPCAAPPYNVL